MTLKTREKYEVCLLFSKQEILCFKSHDLFTRVARTCNELRTNFTFEKSPSEWIAPELAWCWDTRCLRHTCWHIPPCLLFSPTLQQMVYHRCSLWWYSHEQVGLPVPQTFSRVQSQGCKDKQKLNDTTRFQNCLCEPINWAADSLCFFSPNSSWKTQWLSKIFVINEPAVFYDSLLIVM